MKVLVVEGSKGAAVRAVRALHEAGHEVATCVDEGATSFPCRGMHDGGTCPLDGPSVDVALLVRMSADPHPTAEEEGIRCALRHQVPIAIAGEVGSPYTDWAAVVAPGTNGVVAAVEAAAAAPLPRHSVAATEALRAVLAGNGLPTDDARAAVHRQGSHLHVLLRPGCELEPMVADTASVRVLAAVRALDHHVEIIDVSIDA
ncbi:MAG TPA: hypothetical protein VK866_12975 [Acidimicrobiales bacterium]|nr:hypothetical protein [Acidimicrobiales bacterium]